MKGSLPCLSFVAPSGTGKTTLLEDVIRELVELGIRPAVLKASHHDHRLDVAGKDSARFTAAGSGLVGLVGPNLTTFFLEAGHASWPGARQVVDWVASCPFQSFDLVLCEGFSFDEELPKIRVIRAERGREPRERHEDLLAVATDRSEDAPAGVTVLPLDGAAVAAWIRDWAQRGRERGDWTASR